ncbi:amino acid adenylation domain-containing protein, partial [Maribacter sp. 2-571]|uniref:amino acid adenylation domain-containing protein n=1 Tax=Maribacter sp. 2-571 TaxID=3417569 RepID=UPI003D338EC5
LSDIWQELLGVDKVGIRDNFFELGGHSLLATRLVSMVRRRMKIELAIAAIFNSPTIFELGQSLINGPRKSLLPSVVPQERGERIPLSFSQERLWFLDQLQGTKEYHISMALSLTGALDVAVLEKCFKTIVDRHEVLRTVVKSEQGIGYQEMMSADQWTLDTVKLDDAEIVEELVDNFADAPFDLSKDYMFRACLYELGPREYVLAGVFHHIASDGWSEGILMNEFMALYGSMIRKEETNLPELSIQYADYAIWQRKYLEGAVLENQLEYWEGQLSDAPNLSLPTDHVRPSVRSTEGASVQMQLDKELCEALVSLSNSQGVTLFMTLLSAFKVLMYRYSGQEDISVGTPIANRTQGELEGMIGFFVNTLVLRSDLGGNPSFKEFLEQIKETTLGAYDHQLAPFEKVVDRVVKTRDMNVNPLFQVMFVLQNTPNDDSQNSLEFDDFAMEPLVDKGGTNVKFDLTLFSEQKESGIVLDLEYRKDLFYESTIKGILFNFKELLVDIVANPSSKLNGLSMVTKSDRQKVLESFNKNKLKYPSDKTIIDLFEESVLKNPDAIALIFENTELTYKELDQKSNQWARYLGTKGVGKESIVAISANRSLEMVIGILGILKCEAAYLPIDPKHPKDRIQYVLTDSNAKLLLSHSDSEEQLKEVAIDIDIEVIALDNEYLNDISKRKLSKRGNPKNLAYAIYTSGSTGRPKGVMAEHCNLINYINSQTNTYRINESDVILQTSNLVFDASVEQIFLCLLNGASLVLIKEDTLLDETLLKSVIEHHEVTHVHTTPSILKVLDPKIGISSLRRVIVGGEECSVKLANNWIQHYDFYNKYGPTEATITTTIKYFPKGVRVERVSIGAPIHNTDVYILSENLQIQPVGALGELCIGGDGLTRGYLNRPDLTSERFISHPFKENQRLYRTGDLARWSADGELFFMGRQDDQVKVRGYRIELGEIEMVLLGIEGIDGACVLAMADSGGDKRLVGYVVVAGALDRDFIEMALKDRLPEYMVPRLWVFLEELPLTRNGKVDRKSLPDPDVSEGSTVEYVAPSNETEQRLADIWQELLGVEKVGIYDNFFELGGDSIITIQVVSRARRSGYNLNPIDIFECQTIFKLTEVIKGHNTLILGEQGFLEGESEMLPIQRRYFDDLYSEDTHFNQAILLGIDKSIPSSVFSKIAGVLVEHHDGLRFSYQKGESWKQSYSASKGVLAIRDLKAVKQEALSSGITAICEEFQRGLSIDKGEVFKMVFIETPDNETKNRLFIVANHLVIDGVSWRILMDDMNLLLEQIGTNKEIDLGKKGSSYREWANALKEYSVSRRVVSQYSYWKTLHSSHGPLPVDMVDNPSLPGKVLSHNVNLGKESTALLLQGTNRAYSTDINDILLCGLAMAIHEWSGLENIVVGLEGHGRENISGDIDVSTTVGWFTNLYPICLPASSEMSLEDFIKSTKETLRRVPGKGMGYGALRYLHPSA